MKTLLYKVQLQSICEKLLAFFFKKNQEKDRGNVFKPLFKEGAKLQNAT